MNKYNANDYIGKKIHHLTIIKQGSTPSKAIVQCDCEKQTIKEIDLYCLFNGKYLTKSCGCLRTKNIINSNLKHNACYTYEYNRWRKMKARCYDKNNNRYYLYGARGITVCNSWIESFENFLKDMGYSPSNKHTIDRIDNNKGYYKENCRWATRKEQSNNTSTNRFITFNNKTQTLAQWSDEVNIKRTTISERIKKGWSIEEALTIRP